MNNNLDWAYHIANTLYNLGVEDVCICPGSRNTPLTIAFSNNQKFNCTSHIDERSAGYFGLGISKKKNLPTVLISTSGTAIANFFPSIIEANLSKTPIIVITADRPAYLLNTGENQTINQQNIYGNYVRKFQGIGLPNDNLNELTKNIISLYESSVNNIPGPVHINAPFEEPLITKLTDNIDPSKARINLENNEIYNNDDFEISNLKESMIICGELSPDENHDSILLLSEFLNAPILADPTSNIRYYKSHKNIISNYNLFFKNIDINPNLIIRFGSKPTSKILCDFISNHPNVLLVNKYDIFNDKANTFIKSDIETFVENTLNSFDKIDNNSLCDILTAFQKNVKNQIDSLDIDEMMCEGILIKNILDIIKPDTNLFIGNSMAIREMDDLTMNLDKKINIYSNRGASGIDGLLSTALGISSVSKSNANIAILGDLSFYYDMNALIFASKLNISLKLFILNNNGGGIFKQLPISKLNYDKFEKYWITPPNLNLSDIAKSFNVKYYDIKTVSDLKNILNRNNGIEIIDCKIDMNNNYKNEIVYLISNIN